MAPANEISEYKFHIDAFSPSTIPLERLSEYLGYLARILGEKASVHFNRLEGGSTTPVIRVDREALPKVRERIHLVRAEEGPADTRVAFQEMNKRLAEDNANGALYDPAGAKVLRFPGRDDAYHVEFGPISEPGTFEGIPINVGGKLENVPIHLQDGDEIHIVYAPRRVARGIAQHLFTTPVRVEGKGRWMRNRMGEWVMQHFVADQFEVLSAESFADTFARLQKLDAEWKKHPDALEELNRERNGVAIA